MKQRDAMAANERQKWCVVRLITVQKKREVGRLLFATITELAQDRPVPARMRGIDSFDLKASGERLFFRRTLLSKEDATSWYRSLNEGERCTPVPTRKEDREELDGLRFQVPRLEDVQPWPELGLPISEELFSRARTTTINPAPFIGSVPGRLHRRFGDRAGLEVFLRDRGAQAFVARRMHVDLFEYQEYLGSVVYIAPDPVIRQIDHFMVPAKDGNGERIIYRIVPHPGQSLEQVYVTAFDKEARLLTSFKTHQVPLDGILEVDKGTCMGEYGYVVTHEQHGVLAYQPSSPFLRQMNLSLRVASGKRLKVNAPLGDSTDSPRMEYEGNMGSEASNSILGEVTNPGAGVRVAIEARKRERLAEAKQAGQHWFAEGSRAEAAHLIRELLRAARTRVIIADPYLGALQLGQFLYAVHGSEVNVTLLTTKLAFNPRAKSGDTKSGLLQAFEQILDDLNKHQQLVPNVRIISSSSLHDRFLVVDDDVWFVGNSLNNLGVKASMIVKLPDPDEVIERLHALAEEAPKLDAYVDKASRTSNRGETE
ncbi:VPA1262 family N-terminal domain-containing protein [Pseudomonas fluorescens]|uniref:VPA1262 family N-terminal domain-containing protein n=1 Tax=Pseudomonas fluorescens TaxID=294 RepID=UPI0012B70C8C|nr:VPA1262 family N-terminal domain-containing protein [Pseudomonas fluorescens]